MIAYLMYINGYTSYAVKLQQKIMYVNRIINRKKRWLVLSSFLKYMVYDKLSPEISITRFVISVCAFRLPKNSLEV